MVLGFPRGWGSAFTSLQWALLRDLPVACRGQGKDEREDLSGRRGNVGGWHGAWGALCLRVLAGAKGDAREGPEEKAEASSHTRPAFWFRGLRKFMSWVEPQLGLTLHCSQQEVEP